MATASVDDVLRRMNGAQTITYSSLKEKQAEAIRGCMIGDVMAVLPTGYGKTVIIQALPYLSLKPSCVVVVNPLNAIIMEQKVRFGESCVVIDGDFVKSLNRCGEDNMVSSKLQKLKSGNVNFIIGHPELLQLDTIKQLFKQEPLASKITHLVVDEAHCVLSWGKSAFRPAFLELGALRALLLKCKVLALTATATDTSQKEIAESLALREPLIVRESPDRPNIYLEVKRRLPSSGGHNTVEDAVNETVDPILASLKVKGKHFPRTIMYMPIKWCGYVHHRAVTKFLADHPEEVTVQMPNDNRLTCLISQFHAPQTQGMKERITEAMQNPEAQLRLLVCTEAYSMGADPAQVNHVVHLGPPNTIETFIQEIGRAGRDGSSSTATIYFNNSDISSNATHLQPEMRDYVLTTSCRREFLMNYFNFPLDSEQHDKDTCCDNCSNLPSDNSKQTTWQVNSALKDCCFVSLTHYFSLENQAITNCLFPSSVTGLSESVARALSSEPEKFTSAAQLSQAYPKLEESYKSNIITILQAELARFHNLRK